MKTTHLMVALAIVLLSAGCKKSSDPSPSKSQSKGITTSSEAKDIYGSIKGMLSGFESKLGSSFSTSTVPGGAGSAIVSGKKTTSSNSSSTSSSSTSTMDMSVSFSSFASSDVLVSGDVKHYNYNYSRTACSSSGCASATDINQYIKGSGIKVEFTSGGKAIKETIGIDVTRTSSYGTLSGKLTTASGQTFSL